MGFLNDWFGTGSITRDVDKELKLIESVLDDLGNIDKIIEETGVRGKKLERILALEKKAVSKGLSIEHKLEAELQPYIEGKKKTDDLARILLLNRLLRDFREDNLWKELFELWKAEQLLLKEGNSQKIRKNLEEQKHIAMILKKLITFEFNETHMHFSMSVDADIHWKYLKKLWKKEMEGKLKQGEKGITAVYEELVRAGKVFADDLKALKHIMNNFFNGNWPEAKAFLEFERLIFMLDSSRGYFKEFVMKCDLLNAIDKAICGEEDIIVKGKKHIAECMESIVKHNLAHGVKHIEIRFPISKKDGMEFFAQLAMDAEKKFGDRISIRFIEFMIGEKYDIHQFFDSYDSLEKRYKKYIVAVDLLNQSSDSIDRARKSGLPVCIHAGEIFTQRDSPGKTKVENVQKALDEVKVALNLPNIYRIGHAIVLGIDLDKYLSGENPSEVARLVELQKKLIKDTKSKGVIIEVNPTSNFMIHGMKTYADHPISDFSEQDIKFAISTDDRVIFDTNLKKEYYRIARALRWTAEQLEEANRMSREAMLK